MTAARLYIGDVFDRMTELEDGAYDLIITSPPFLALRSYLPDGHPDKHKEIGSEATPAAFLDVMLALTAEWGRLLAPHGSIAVEIGDTYSGSGGAGGDYNDGGLREGQERFDGSASRVRVRTDYDADYDKSQRGKERGGTGRWGQRFENGGPGWPLAKSLAMIPELYAASLAYGRNLLTGQASPAGRWRVRNLKPWIRSNPPVGALGDKERPATSYITVATRAVGRYFDLDAVRTAPNEQYAQRRHVAKSEALGVDGVHKGKAMGGTYDEPTTFSHPAGAPPLDWWHHVDATIDHEIDQRAGKANGWSPGPKRTGKERTAERGGNWSSFPDDGTPEARNLTVGARGVHIRRALERAGILTTLDALDVSPKGYAGAHYAVWPPELVLLLAREMVPRRVCTTCGRPSRRIIDSERIVGDVVPPSIRRRFDDRVAQGRTSIRNPTDASFLTSGGTSTRSTVGWSDCGHNTWRPGRLLDPFAGSGTTLAVATGLGFDADGIDLDERNADLARERVGMFLEVIDRPATVTEAAS